MAICIKIIFYYKKNSILLYLSQKQETGIPLTKLKVTAVMFWGYGFG